MRALSSDVGVGGRTGGSNRRWVWVWVCAVLGFALAVWVGWRMGEVYTQPDTQHYLSLAAGGETMMPFASRQLGPLLVRGMGREMSVPVEDGFAVEGVLSLAAFVGFAGWVLIRCGAQPWMVLAVLGMFFWARMFNGLVLPDLLNAALLSGFLVLLWQERRMAAATMLIPLTLSRESAVLVLMCLLLAGWQKLRRTEVAAALGATGVGLLAIKSLTMHALPNQEHLPPGVYLLAKASWNLMKNLFGISPWANVYPACAVPKWEMAVRLGPLHSIGWCGVDFHFALVALAAGLGSFGLLPLVLWKLYRAGGLGRRLEPARSDLLVRFCLLYGGLSFILAPLLGELFERLFGYGWPLFLVALPVLLQANGARFFKASAAMLFVALHLAVSWMAAWTAVEWFPERKLALEALAYGAGWFLLGRTFLAGSPAGPSYDELPSVPADAS